MRSPLMAGIALATLGSIANGAPQKPAVTPTPTAIAAAAADSSAARPDSAASNLPAPDFFLSWRAPFGSPRARTDVTLRGGESAQPETLYLSFDPGRNAETFYGMSAMLAFRVPVGDTLGSLWHFGGGTMNRRNVQIEFPTDHSWGAPRPFKAAGFGASNYDRNPERGQLQIIYAVQVEQAAPIRAGQRFCFARVILPAGSTLDEGDGQAVCVEWVKGEIGIALEGEGASVRGKAVERFVSVNSPGGKVCTSFRRAPDGWAPEGEKPR